MEAKCMFSEFPFKKVEEHAVHSRRISMIKIQKMWTLSGTSVIHGKVSLFQTPLPGGQPPPSLNVPQKRTGHALPLLAPPGTGALSFSCTRPSRFMSLLQVAQARKAEGNLCDFLFFMCIHSAY